MRLHEKIEDINLPDTTDVQLLLKKLLDSATASLAVDLHCGPLQKPDQSIHNFFHKYYIKPNVSGMLHCCNLDTQISLIEAEILNFFLSDESKNKPFLFVDHAGRGKSTILKYISRYLYDKENELKEEFVPIYLSLRPYESAIQGFAKAIELYQFLEKLIKETAFKFAKDHFLNNTLEILKWLNEKYPSDLQGLYSSSETNKEIVDEPDKFIEKLAEHEKDKLQDFILGVLSHYSTYICPIALIIDDADNFSVDVQRAVLGFSKRKISLGFRVLVALRVSTWRSFESDRRDYEPYLSLEQIGWTFEQLKKFLLVRLENGHEQVKLQDQYQVNLEKKEIVDAFFKLFVKDHTTDFLIKTSNFNLHSLMRKLALIPQSWHFRDRYLLKEQLVSHVPRNRTHGVSLWNTYNLVFGSYRGSFQSNNDNARSGIVNLFCTREDNHEPYTFFARMHILARLRDATTEAENIKMKKIEDEYRTVFGDNLSFSRVFGRALFRLVQSSLVCTRSCRRYKTFAEVQEHIDSDALYISEAGLYYLNVLINRIDYFFFMKDDIDWPSHFNLKDIEHVKVNMSRSRRHKSTLKSLYNLGLIEMNMLKEIQRQLKNSGDSSIVSTYVSLFSGKRIGKGNGDITFTYNMLIAYKEYLKWSRDDHEKEFKNEYININTLFEEYDDVRRSFS